MIYQLSASKRTVPPNFEFMSTPNCFYSDSNLQITFLSPFCGIFELTAAFAFNRHFQDLIKKILIVFEGKDESIGKTWTELKQLEDIQVMSCHSTDLISFCTKERYLLIFLEMSSVAGHAQKLCSTVR